MSQNLQPQVIQALVAATMADATVDSEFCAANNSVNALQRQLFLRHFGTTGNFKIVDRRSLLDCSNR